MGVDNLFQRKIRGRCAYKFPLVHLQREPYCDVHLRVVSTEFTLTVFSKVS